jgi:ribosomal protein S18 acetylase RimI-like enzyme
MVDPVLVRTVTAADLPAVARLAAGLVQYHRALDPLRFMTIENVTAGYEAFLRGELANPAAVVLCASRRGDPTVLGYAYAVVEGRDWNALLDRHGAIHDVFVDASARRLGVAEAMLSAACERLTQRGVPRVVLHTAVQNVEAQALFAKLGFRPTMLEMTRELADADK